MNDKLIVLMLQIVVMLVFFIAILLVIRQNISIYYEKRIGRYSIRSKDNSKSISEKLLQKYYNLVLKMRKLLSKSVFIKKYSKRYDRYITFEHKDKIKAIDFISYKITIGIFFIVLTFFSMLIEARLATVFELIVNFLIGYFILDIYLIIRQKSRVKKIENDMLRAVIIMNNAFKSGKSTMQAVLIAAEELPNPISDEFMRIYEDMKYGLSIDVVFDRFAKRINIDEAKYISSSLTLLNRTGGNIVKVFNSIERTLFDKKKLEDELKNLTASSKLVVKILTFVPFIFILLVYILDPTYFDPLFNSTAGYIIIGLIIIVSAIYAWLLQKIMKVRG